MLSKFKILIEVKVAHMEIFWMLMIKMATPVNHKVEACKYYDIVFDQGLVSIKLILIIINRI